MTKILVAIDFSEAARRSMIYAASFAKLFQAELALLHAYYIPTPIGDVPGYLPLSINEVQDENEASLQREIEYLATECKIKAEGFVRMGMATGVIRDLAKEIDAGLVIMGMKGSGNTSSIFGSTVISCIRKLKLPLLVVPGDAGFTALKHISFAADFSNREDMKSFGILEEIVAKFDSRVQIIHVQKTEGELAAAEVAGRMKTDLMFGKIPHDFHTTVSEDIEKGIHSFIEEHPTDLLVMVAHHHNLFERLFGNSHTRLIAYQSHLPVLVLHDQ